MSRASVILTTNDPATPTTRIDVTWRETADLAFDPTQLDLGWVPGGGEPVTRRVWARVAQRLPRADLRVEASHPALGAVWDADGARDDDDPDFARIPVTIRLTPSEPGDHAAEARVVDGEGRRLGALRGLWRAGPPVEATPRAIFVSDWTEGDDLRVNLTLAAQGGQSIDVLRIEVGNHGIDFEREREDPSRLVVRVVIPSGVVGQSPSHRLRLWRALGTRAGSEPSEWP